MIMMGGAEGIIFYRDILKLSSHSGHIEITKSQTWVQIHCIVFKYKYYKFSKYKYNCKYFGQDSI